MKENNEGEPDWGQIDEDRGTWGDGYCGWPTALHLSDAGHEVVIVDSLSRGGWDDELEAKSLTPVVSMVERVAIWQEVSGQPLTAEAGKELILWG